MAGYAAIVLAGGAGRRLGGRAKPSLRVGGRPMLDRVLSAVANAEPRVVVGPAALSLPSGVRQITEEPAGGGPVAATAAGLTLIDSATPWVALLAADLPLITTAALTALRAAAEERGTDGACYVDADGRRQLLCGGWRVAALRGAVASLSAARGGLASAAMRALFAPLSVADVTWDAAGPAPWFDCDTDAQLRQAEQWTR